MAIGRAPDPGGIFRFDDERHVLGHLRSPYDDGGGLTDPSQGLSVEEVVDRLRRGGGPYADMVWDDVVQVLTDLQADGDSTQDGDGLWTMTAQGYSKLTGPNGYEPPPMSEFQVTALHESGQIDEEGLRAWKDATGHAGA